LKNLECLLNSDLKIGLETKSNEKKTLIEMVPDLEDDPGSSILDLSCINLIEQSKENDTKDAPQSLSFNKIKDDNFESLD